MQNILALDTSLPDTSVTLRTPSGYFLRQAASADSHNEELANLVDQVLKEGGISSDILDLILLGAGPGSFTGLRIGYSFVQGLSLASNKPVYAVSSLLAAAFENGDRNGLFIAISDARRGEYFCASVAVVGGVPTVVKQPSILTREAIDLHLSEAKQSYNQAKVIDLNSTAQHLSNNLISLWDHGDKLFEKHSVKSLSGLKPLYIRPVAAMTIEERKGIDQKPAS